MSLILSDPSPQSSPLRRGEAEGLALPLGMFAHRVQSGCLALCKGEGEGEALSVSFIEKREHEFRFGNDCVIHHAMTFGFRQSFAARFGQLSVDKDGVTG